MLGTNKSFPHGKFNQIKCMADETDPTADGHISKLIAAHQKHCIDTTYTYSPVSIMMFFARVSPKLSEI